MNKYISILRGINVSGQKIIKMAELRLHYESLGFNIVTTYIQSGNVVFCSDIQDSDKIKNLIEQKIEEVYGFSVPVLILTPIKLNEILTKNPFDLNKIDTSKFCFTFLNSIPDKSLVDNILHYNNPAEKFIVLEDVVYFHCTIGFGKTKLTNNFFEKKLKVSATSRNWKTSKKLYEIASGISCDNN